VTVSTILVKQKWVTQCDSKTHLVNSCYLLLCNKNHPNKYEVITHGSFNLHFLNSDSEYFFIYSLSICMYAEKLEPCILGMGT
jgi:hypothetical protein